MTLDAPRLTAADLHDVDGRRPVLSSEVSYRGRVWDVRTDRVDLGDGGVAVRDYLEHPGAVVVLAVREDRGEPEVLVIRQYRHPIGAEDWELPAGLLDVAGEAPAEAARRELLEEADLRAASWEELLTFTPSPGSLGERITLFLATGLCDVPEAELHEREHEEMGMPVGWVSLDDAVTAVLAGQVRNGPLILGLMTYLARRRPEGQA